MSLVRKLLENTTHPTLSRKGVRSMETHIRRLPPRAWKCTSGSLRLHFPSFERGTSLGDLHGSSTATSGGFGEPRETPEFGDAAGHSSALSCLSVPNPQIAEKVGCPVDDTSKMAGCLKITDPRALTLAYKLPLGSTECE